MRAEGRERTSESALFQWVSSYGVFSERGGRVETRTGRGEVRSHPRGVYSAKRLQFVSSVRAGRLKKRCLSSS